MANKCQNRARHLVPGHVNMTHFDYLGPSPATTHGQYEILGAQNYYSCRLHLRHASPRALPFDLRAPLHQTMYMHELYAWYMISHTASPCRRDYRRALARRLNRTGRVRLVYRSSPVALRRRHNICERRQHRRLSNAEMLEATLAANALTGSARLTVGPIFSPPPPRPFAVQVLVAAWSPCTTCALHALRFVAFSLSLWRAVVRLTLFVTIAANARSLDTSPGS